MFQADFWKKFSFSRFWHFFAIFCHFWPKNQVFELFLQNRTSEFHVTCSKTRDNCFQSFNGSVVSGKILVLAVLAHFWSKIHCLWWQIEVFDHFWPISCNLLMFVWQFLFFGPPHRGWDLWFSLRSSVRSSVQERSRNPFIGIFWFLAESWGFLMRRKWHFRILVEKSRFGVFGPFMSKNGHFWPKINILANISKSGHRIFLVLYI